MDKNELLRRIAEFADGRADAAAVAELNEVLSRDAEARLLYLQWMGMQAELEQAAPSVVPARRERSWRWWLVRTAAAAVILFGGWVIWALQGRFAVGESDLVGGAEVVDARVEAGLRVAMADGATWEGEQQPLVGNLVPQGRVLQLGSGKVELADGEVRYVLSAPARFVAGVDGLQLDRGDLLVRVRGERQVTILTPSASLRDLGTVFGVTVRDDEETCHVFEGVVEAEANWLGANGDAVPSVWIKAGKSRSLRPQVGGGFAAVERANWLRFPWSLVARDGVRSLGGLVELAAAPAEVFDVAQPMALVPEGAAVLAAALPVDLVGAGSFAGPFGVATAELPAGQRVRSYVAHFAPGRHKPPRQWRVAVIEFEKPIVGVSCSGEALAAADRVFGNVAAGELVETSLAEKGHLALEKEDAIRISADRRQIAIYMAAWFVDQIRIFTEE